MATILLIIIAVLLLSGFGYGRSSPTPISEPAGPWLAITSSIASILTITQSA